MNTVCPEQIQQPIVQATKKINPLFYKVEILDYFRRITHEGNRYTLFLFWLYNTVLCSDFFKTVVWCVLFSVSVQQLISTNSNLHKSKKA